MYQNTIYIYISWYRKIYWFPVKKILMPANSRAVIGHMIHIYFGSSLHKVWLCQVSSLWDIWQILGRVTPICLQHWKEPCWIGLNHCFQLTQHVKEFIRTDEKLFGLHIVDGFHLSKRSILKSYSMPYSEIENNTLQSSNESISLS